MVSRLLVGFKFCFWVICFGVGCFDGCAWCFWWVSGRFLVYWMMVVCDVVVSGSGFGGGFWWVSGVWRFLPSWDDLVLPGRFGSAWVCGIDSYHGCAF